MDIKEQIMIKALKKIAYPISYLQEEAAKSGAKLDGHFAALLAQDSNWLRDIAENCLKEIGEEKK
jgi:hypothetical protein